MYRTIKPNDTITMWDIRHNTIAGDCAVTVFIQVRQAPACQAACGRKGKKPVQTDFFNCVTGYLDFCHLVGNGSRRHADGQDCRVPLPLGALTLSLSLALTYFSFS